MSRAELAKAAFALPIAGGLLKCSSEHYDVLKADFGLIAPTICLLGGFGLLCFGFMSFRRALASKTRRVQIGHGG